MTQNTDAEIARIHAAGWAIEDLRERRGSKALWLGNTWQAVIRDPGAYRFETGVGQTPAAALRAAFAEINPMSDELSELLG